MTIPSTVVTGHEKYLFHEKSHTNVYNNWIEPRANVNKNVLENIPYSVVNLFGQKSCPE